MKLKTLFITVAGMTILGTAYAADSFNIGGFDPTTKKQEAVSSPTLDKQSKAAALRNADALLHAANNPVAGNPYGTLSIVEFFDYQCHHCVEMDPRIISLINSNSDLRVVYKEFPIRGEVSEFAAKAALAANIQGKYLPFHEALMKASESLSQEKILQLAAKVGLDVNKLKADMSSETVVSQIAQNYQLAQSMGINGTPAFFVSKTMHPSDATSEVILGQVDTGYMQNLLNKFSR